MRYALGVEYDGTDFFGWQRLSKRSDGASPSDNVGTGSAEAGHVNTGQVKKGQVNTGQVNTGHMPDNGPTVQQALETALSTVADTRVDTVCAGRTDSGVHALCQVVHFDSEAKRDPRAWILGATTLLPDSVCVRWCVPVADDFHARFSARARRYRYSLLNRAVRPALGRQYLSWIRRPLDAAAMQRAAQTLLGEHDFSAFRTVHCQAPHARRVMQRVEVSRDGDEVHIEVQANAFLHHMVRNIVGTLMEVGAGEQPEAWVAEVLAGRDRTRAGPTAPAAGLVFLGPCYPAEWGLPREVTLAATL